MLSLGTLAVPQGVLTAGEFQTHTGMGAQPAALTLCLSSLLVAPDFSR